MKSVSDKIFAYLFYSASLAVLLAYAYAQNLYLLAFSSMLLALSAIYLNAGSIVNNMLFRRQLVSNHSGVYALDMDMKSAVKDIGSGFRAVSAARLLLKEEISSEKISAAIAKAELPFEYIVRLRNIDARRFLEGLETRKRMKEIAIAKTDPKQYAKLNAARRELEAIKSEMNKVSGSRPTEIEVVLRAFAENLDARTAARESRSCLENMVVLFSGAIDFECEMLNGQDLLDEIGD